MEKIENELLEKSKEAFIMAIEQLNIVWKVLVFLSAMPGS